MLFLDPPVMEVVIDLNFLTIPTVFTSAGVTGAIFLERC